MLKDIQFRYFPDYLKWACFSDEPCIECEEHLCLEGVLFHHEDDPEYVCVSKLISGEYKVYVPEDLIANLVISVRQEYPQWTEEKINEWIQILVEALSKTPPVPWIQNNIWPVCHADFCKYLGEWSQEMFNNEAADGNGQAYLMSVIQDPAGLGDPDWLWNTIATEWSAIFMFECFTCKKRIGIDQSY